MKKAERYISKGVSEKINPYIYNELFILMEKSYWMSELSEFKLRKSESGVQVVEQFDEESDKSVAHLIVTNYGVKESVLIFRDMEIYSMILKSEMDKIMDDFMQRFEFTKI